METKLSTYHELSCDCGDIRLTACGQPLVSGFCHCAACRLAFGVTILSASVWAHEAVKRQVVGDGNLIGYRLSAQGMWRYHCSNCGRLMHGRNRHGHIVIPNERFRESMEGALSPAIEPAEHFHYDQRLLDIADELPRHTQGYDAVYPELIDTKRW